MCVLVSWATCGTGKSRKPDEPQTSEQTKQEENPHKDRYDRLNLPRETREEIGLKCKRLMDQGRVEYLTSLGFKSELVYYVQTSITLENVCLLAWKETSWIVLLYWFYKNNKFYPFTLIIITESIQNSWSTWDHWRCRCGACTRGQSTGCSHFSPAEKARTGNLFLRQCLVRAYEVFVQFVRDLKSVLLMREIYSAT